MSEIESADTTTQPTATTTTSPKRVFCYDGHEFPDPGENYSNEDMRQSLKTVYPELANCRIQEEKQKDGSVKVTFIKTAGEKGRTA